MLRLVKRLKPVLLQLEQLLQITPYAEACECPLALQKSGDDAGRQMLLLQPMH